MKLFWIENAIDLSYIKYLIEELELRSESLDKYRLFYRPTKTLYKNLHDLVNNENGENHSSIGRFVKSLAESGFSTIITGYNISKYSAKDFEGLKVILLGHSHLGPVRYNIESYLTPLGDNCISIVPSYYKDLFPEFNWDKYPNIRFVNNYYKNEKHIENYNRVFNGYKDQILILPHWTTPIYDIQELVERVRKTTDKKIIIKYHPNLEVEFLKARKYIIGSKVGDDIRSVEAKNTLEEFKTYAATLNCEVFMDSEKSLTDAIDESKYFIFDGASASLVEAIVRDFLFSESEKEFSIYENDMNSKLVEVKDSLKSESNSEVDRVAFNTLKLRLWTSVNDLKDISTAYGVPISYKGEDITFSKIDYSVGKKIAGVYVEKNQDDKLLSLIETIKIIEED